MRPETHLFHRGDHRQPKQVVKPGDLTIAAADGSRLEITDQDAKAPSSGRRLAYARHLTSGRHPLVGRVLANRVWLHHFGRGMVETPGDFGALGSRPTHPELLDWLADELVRQGWSLKKLHKLIMTLDGLPPVVTARASQGRRRSRQFASRPLSRAPARRRIAARSHPACQRPA